MKKLSLPFTKALKIYPLVASLAAFCVAIVFIKIFVLVSVFMLVAGLSTVYIWFKYVRYSDIVYMDDTSLHVKRAGGSEVIPFKAIVAVYRPMYLRYPLIVVTYENKSGSREQVVIIPSLAVHKKLFEGCRYENNAIPQSWT
jgi:hypothetical protein